MGVEAAGPILTLLGTFGGIWAVIALFNRYQADFTTRYRTELATERELRSQAELEADREREQRIAAYTEVGRLQAVLAAHNIKDTR